MVVYLCGVVVLMLGDEVVVFFVGDFGSCFSFVFFFIGGFLVCDLFFDVIFGVICCGVFLIVRSEER